MISEWLWTNCCSVDICLEVLSKIKKTSASIANLPSENWTWCPNIRNRNGINSNNTFDTKIKSSITDVIRFPYFVDVIRRTLARILQAKAMQNFLLRVYNIHCTWIWCSSLQLEKAKKLKIWIISKANIHVFYS
jgi:hypothetical protein